MQAFQNRFQNFVKSQNLFQNEDKILLAVSGGVDSMVLANCFLKLGYSFALAHCNFKLRGKESDGDEQFVLDWAKKNKVIVHSKALPITAGSIQLEARRVRYAWFEELCTEFGYSKIATAHHLNDSIETFLINLSRGTGISGLTGISTSTNNIIRPLLFATKNEIFAYANANKILWREDASNQKTEYQRNSIRLKIIPELEKLNPSLIKTFELTSERLDLTNQLLLERVEEIRNRYFDGEKLNLGWMQNQPSDMILLENLLKEYGFSYVQSKEIYANKNNVGAVFFSEKFKVLVDRNVLFIKEKEQEKGIDLIEIEGVGTYFLSDEIKIVISQVSDYQFDNKKNIAFFDADLLQFPLTLRKWENGDFFQPLGMRGVKKVSDFLIDEKIPLVQKERTFVLVSNNEIIWLVNHRISEKFKISNQTKKVLKFEII